MVATLLLAFLPAVAAQTECAAHETCSDLAAAGISNCCPSDTGTFFDCCPLPPPMPLSPPPPVCSADFLESMGCACPPPPLCDSGSSQTQQLFAIFGLIAFVCIVVGFLWTGLAKLLQPRIDSCAKSYAARPTRSTRPCYAPPGAAV